jgi:hypothetical protein
MSGFFFFSIYTVPGIGSLDSEYCTAWELVPGLCGTVLPGNWSLDFQICTIVINGLVVCAIFDGYHSDCYWDHSALLIHTVIGEDHSSISARLNDNLNDDELFTWPGFYFTVLLDEAGEVWGCPVVKTA